MKHTLKRFAIGVTLVLSATTFLWAQGDAKDLYLSKCATCHGPDGAGKTAMGKKLKVPDVRTSKTSAADMEKTVTSGKGENMDGFGKDLNKTQIKGLVDYYRSLAK
jgi:mono/diheme cytochrome c family protein